MIFLKPGDGAWSSGGLISDSKIDGQIQSGSQQQFLAKNSRMGSWSGSNWNMVFVGDQGAPGQSFPTYTNVPSAPVDREKTYLYIDGSGAWQVFVPAAQTNASATTWSGKTQAQRHDHRPHLDLARRPRQRLHRRLPRLQGRRLRHRPRGVEPGQLRLLQRQPLGRGGPRLRGAPDPRGEVPRHGDRGPRRRRHHHPHRQLHRRDRHTEQQRGVPDELPVAAPSAGHPHTAVPGGPPWYEPSEDGWPPRSASFRSPPAASSPPPGRHRPPPTPAPASRPTTPPRTRRCGTTRRRS
ncbi:hypothetical protein GPN2_14339 [Streptomyces murinus]